MIIQYVIPISDKWHLRLADILKWCIDANWRITCLRVPYSFYKSGYEGVEKICPALCWRMKYNIGGVLKAEFPLIYTYDPQQKDRLTVSVEIPATMNCSNAAAQAFWIGCEKHGTLFHSFKCSACGRKYRTEYYERYSDYEFCPYCGRTMADNTIMPDMEEEWQ